jgi:drug/metabolite transporter (DMT)-like permease
VVVGMRRLPARRASAFLLLNPPTAVLLSWLLLGEHFSIGQFVGAALVLVAMAGASGLLPRRLVG